MNESLTQIRPATTHRPSDLSESLDVRLLVAGRLTPTAIQIRHERAELAAVLGRAMEPRPDVSVDSDPAGNSR